MADIKVYGTLVDATVEDKVAYANQVWHKTWDNGEGLDKGKDVAGILDELEKKVENIPEPTEQNYKGRINITNLLKIPLAEINENDLWLVYTKGSDEYNDWSEGDFFKMDGTIASSETFGEGEEPGSDYYKDGTFIQWMNGNWVPLEDSKAKTARTFVLDPGQDKVGLIRSLYSNEGAYPDLYSAGFNGIKLAEVLTYAYDEESGSYKEDKVSRGQPGQMYYGNTNKWTLSVPYAKFSEYSSGAGNTMTRNYKGGVFTDEDYRKFSLDAKHFIISSKYPVNIKVTKDDTKGTAPYNPEYGYTNIQIENFPSLNEYYMNGTLITFMCDISSLIVDPDYRNVRVKFGTDVGSWWYPLFGKDEVLDGSKYFKSGVISNTFQFRKDIHEAGAFHKVLTDGTIKEIKLNGQSVQDEDGVINLEVDSNSTKSLKSREPMSSSDWTTAQTNSIGTTSTSDEFNNTIWEEIGYMGVSGESDIIKSVVFSVRSYKSTTLLGTLGCQFTLTKDSSASGFSLTSVSCKVDNPALENRFLISYNNGAIRLYTRRDSATQQLFLYCNSSEMPLVQSELTLWYKYGQLIGSGTYAVSKFILSVVVGSDEYRAGEDGRLMLPVFPDHHLSSNFSNNTGWSEVGYASYDDFYNLKKTLTYSITEQRQIVENETEETKTSSWSGNVMITLCGTTNYSNKRFTTFECLVDNENLADKIVVVYDRNISDKTRNIKIYVKCAFPYQKWILQDLTGVSPFICSEHTSINDYSASISTPTSGQITSAVYTGHGTITEVQLNGKTVSKSGVANVKALPLNYFETTDNNGITGASYWKEIAFFDLTDWQTGIHSFSQIFSARDRIATTDMRCGVLSWSMRIAEGSISHLFCNTDNPNFEGLFKVVYNKATFRCSIYGKLIGNGWGGWTLTTISNTNYFKQGLNSLVTSEPTATATGSKATLSTCYTGSGETGTITEVRLNGISLATSGVADVPAIPLKEFTIPASGYAGNFREIAHKSGIASLTALSGTTYSETFVVTAPSTSTECRDGLLTVEFNSTDGKINSLKCFTDNPALANYFAVMWNNSDECCRIFAAQPIAWKISCLSNTIFEQVTSSIVYPSSNFDTNATDRVVAKAICYTAGKSEEIVQVQSDWTMTDTSDLSYIKNKPEKVHYKLLNPTSSGHSVYVYTPLINIGRELRQGYSGLKYTVTSGLNTYYNRMPIPTLVMFTDVNNALKNKDYYIELDMSENFFNCNSSGYPISWTYDDAGEVSFDSDTLKKTNWKLVLNHQGIDSENNYPFPTENGNSYSFGLWWFEGALRYNLSVEKVTDINTQKVTEYGANFNEFNKKYNNSILFMLTTADGIEHFPVHLYNGVTNSIVEASSNGTQFESVKFIFDHSKWKTDGWIKAIGYPYEEEF